MANIVSFAIFDQETQDAIAEQIYQVVSSAPDEERKTLAHLIDLYHDRFWQLVEQAKTDANVATNLAAMMQFVFFQIDIATHSVEQIQARTGLTTKDIRAAMHKVTTSSDLTIGQTVDGMVDDKPARMTRIDEQRLRIEPDTICWILGVQREDERTISYIIIERRKRPGEHE